MVQDQKHITLLLTGNRWNIIVLGGPIKLEGSCNHNIIIWRGEKIWNANSVTQGIVYFTFFCCNSSFGGKKPLDILILVIIIHL